MKNLLQKPLGQFAKYAFVVLLCSIPVYYFVVDYIWLNELDEHNSRVVNRIKSALLSADWNTISQTNQIKHWHQIQPGLTIAPVLKAREDSVYSQERIDTLDPEMDNERYRGLVSYVSIDNQNYRIAVETNVEEVDETLAAIALITIFFFLILIIGFVLLNRKIAQKSWRPFWNTLNKLKAFDLKTTAEVSFEKTDILEFEELHHALNTLIKQNINSYKQQKTFLENASHELQTPFAVLKSKIDLLMQQENISPEQAKIIADISIPLSRVSRMNKNLLMLSKIENQQFVQTENVPVKAVIEETVELLCTPGMSQNIDVYLHDDVILECNQTLLEMLINNLILNAIRHKTQGSGILVQLQNQKFTVTNGGTQPLDAQNIFKRFGSSTPNAANSGLGLAIAKEICMRYQWSLSYHFKENQHIFSVTF